MLHVDVFSFKIRNFILHKFQLYTHVKFHTLLLLLCGDRMHLNALLTSKHNNNQQQLVCRSRRRIIF